MTTVAITVPLLRTSLVHIPRRDLVLAGNDSVALRVTVIESDNYEAMPIDITGGVGGPGAQFSVWTDAWPWTPWDYGAGYIPVIRTQPVYSNAGVPVVGLGAFDFSFPSGTMAGWPRRCGWSVQLNYDTDSAELLMAGRLYVRQSLGGVAFALQPVGLLTDDSIPVHTDIEERVLT